MRKPVVILVFIILSIQNLRGQKPKLNIFIDDKVETLYAVAYLDHYFLINNHDNLYKQKLNTKKFQELKNHKAVLLFDSLSKTSDFQGYKIVDWVLQFDSFPNLNQIRRVIEPYPFAKNEHVLSDFKQALIQFHQEPLFQKYRAEIMETNAQIITQVQSSKTVRELPGYLEDYYGKKLGSYNVILSAFLHTGGFNSEMIFSNGQKAVYAVIGPNGEIDFVPYFDRDYIETDMVIHEFGHSFVNPITEKFSAEIEKLKAKYYTKELEATGNDNGYTEWKYVFNELLLRATTIKITEKHFGKAQAKKNLEDEVSEGFGLVSTMVKVLEEYQLNRNKYTTFESFCPVLIERMK